MKQAIKRAAASMFLSTVKTSRTTFVDGDLNSKLMASINSPEISFKPAYK